jgi:hypothetical protein
MAESVAEREAVVLVHGINGRSRNECLQLLLHGLEQVPERWKVIRSGLPLVDGLEGQAIHVERTKGDAGRTLDVYEAFWGDLMPSLTQQPVIRRVGQGASLLSYWLFSRVWAGIRKYRWLSLQLVLTTLVVLFWYYGALATFLSASSSESSTLQDLAKSEFLAPLAGLLQWIGAKMGTWKVWAVATVLLGLVPTNQAVDAINLSRLYLLDWRPGMEAVGVRARTRKRIAQVLRSIVESGNYERVTVVAHSFGVVLAVDVLGDFESNHDVELRLLTLGGPLEVLVHREQWVSKEIEKCVNNEHVTTWLDIYSEEDWLGFRTPGPGQHPKLQHHETSHRASLVDKLLGRTHRWYYGNEEVLAYVLGVPPQRLPLPAEQQKPERQAS